MPQPVSYTHLDVYKRQLILLPILTIEGGGGSVDAVAQIARRHTIGQPMLSETLLVEDDLVLRHKLVTIAQSLSASWRLTHLRHKRLGDLIGNGKVVSVDIDIDTVLLSSPTGLSRDIVLLDTCLL